MAQGLETRRHEDAKARRFFKTKLLINGKCFQPFELIEPIEPFEWVENLQPLQPLKHHKPLKLLKPRLLYLPSFPNKTLPTNNRQMLQINL